uniref:Fibrinogen C-terminal domain-containing protein n=1 Tax=Anopheles minimus TaxID=112268 RepID=A0A182WBG0_9DIPT
MFLKAVFVMFCVMKLVSHHQLNCAHVDLRGLHFELLLTHLSEVESRIQTTLQELKLGIGVCGSPSLGSDSSVRRNTLLPSENPINFRRETVTGIGEDRTVDGEWIVFQWRFNGSLLFNRSWNDYRAGFGDTEGEHWLGLENLHKLLAKGPHELLVVMENQDGEIGYAHYDNFSIGTAVERYPIKTIGEYSGTAGDSLSFHIGSKFTTYDQDNDSRKFNCASMLHGGWWFNSCYASFLNGEYIPYQPKSYKEGGLIWIAFVGPFSSLKSSKMMVRQRGS